MAPTILQQVFNPDNEAEHHKEEEDKEDVEFIQPPSKKKSKSTTQHQHNSMGLACIKRHWKKRNSECQARMSLLLCWERRQCIQYFHLAAKVLKETILFLEHEIRAEKKPKTQPKSKAMVHTPPTHPDITTFLQ